MTRVSVSSVESTKGVSETDRATKTSRTTKPSRTSGLAGTDRRSAQREATRARLFSETVEEFKQQGFAGTEIAAITQRVGLTRGAFYVHFASKDEVLRELLLIEERQIADEALLVSQQDVPLEAVFGAVVDAVLRSEQRLGRRLVRDLCAGQFRPEVTQGQDAADHPVGLMLIGAIAQHATEVDAVDLAMTFLTGLFGLLATEYAPLEDRRRRLDLLVRMAAQGATAS